jgi:NADH:ubiquinone oxidoreductase subunit E
MRGFPKHINTKKDIENLMKQYPEKTKRWLEEAARDYEGWVPEKKLEKIEDGIIDKSSRVKTITTEDGKEEHYQEKYTVMPGNKLVQIGMTKKEVEKLIT